MAEDADFDYVETVEETTDIRRTPGRRVWGPEPPDTGKMLLYGAGIVAAGGMLWWLLKPKEAQAGTGSGGSGSGGRRPTSGGSDDDGDEPVVVPDDDPIFGEAPFPPVKAGVQWDLLDRLASKAEEITEIKGLRDYLLAVAEWESDGVPTAWNNTTDAKPALRLFCKDFNYNDRFKENPWRPEVCDWSDPRAERWGWSGGWFQMMTATALATGDEYGVNLDPARIFDPPFQVAFAADLVNDFKKGYGAQTWGDVRAGWALPKWAKPDNNSEGKAKAIENFKKALNRVGRGVDKELYKKTFSAKHYPGFQSLLHQLLEFEGRL